MTKIISSPFTRTQEISMIYQRIESCTSIDEMNYASQLVALFEESRPDEKSVIQDMRNLVCDLTFQFFLERYPTSKK